MRKWKRNDCSEEAMCTVKHFRTKSFHTEIDVFAKNWICFWNNAFTNDNTSLLGPREAMHALTCSRHAAMRAGEANDCHFARWRAQNCTFSQNEAPRICANTMLHLIITNVTQTSLLVLLVVRLMPCVMHLVWIREMLLISRVQDSVDG